MRCLIKDFSIHLLEFVIIVNEFTKKHYIVVIKKAGARGCRGGVNMPESKKLAGKMKDEIRIFFIDIKNRIWGTH